MRGDQNPGGIRDVFRSLTQSASLCFLSSAEEAFERVRIIAPNSNPSSDAVSGHVGSDNSDVNSAKNRDSEFDAKINEYQKTYMVLESTLTDLRPASVGDIETSLNFDKDMRSAITSAVLAALYTEQVRLAFRIRLRSRDWGLDLH